MRRWLAMIVALGLLMAMPVWAVEEPAFAVDTVTAQPGETVDVTIRLENNPGLASAKLMVSFDEYLTLTEVVYGQDLGGMTMAPPVLTSPVTLNWISAFEELGENGVYATLTFTLAENAPAGVHEITLTYDENDVYNILEENVAFAVINGGIKVEGGAAQTEPSHSVPTQPSSVPGDPTNPDHGDGIWIGALALAAAALGGVLFLRKKK